MNEIRISDITMKQTGPDISLSFKEKIELSKLLDKLGDRHRAGAHRQCQDRCPAGQVCGRCREEQHRGRACCPEC